MNRLVAAVLAGAGVVHLIPIFGVFGSNALSRLYGIEVVDPNMELLLRHRAVLFGVLGIGFIGAAARREWHSGALGIAILSTLSFILLALVSPDRTPQIDRVVIVDVVLVALLALAVFCHVRDRAQSRR